RIRQCPSLLDMIDLLQFPPQFTCPGLLVMLIQFA
ncbi:unnamed protein product, partial [marine sediment metagenome]